MRLVAFADVQGNPHAVQAILLAARKVDDAQIYCLGNAIGAGPDPAACLERLRKAHVTLVRGEREAAALGMPGGDPQLKVECKEILAKLPPAEAGYVREASPPRRMVVGGRRVLLTGEASPRDVGAADVVLRPGARAVVRREGSRIEASAGNAGVDEDGESPFLVYDTEAHEARVHRAAWDRTVLRRNRYGETTRKL